MGGWGVISVLLLGACSGSITSTDTMHPTTILETGTPVVNAEIASLESNASQPESPGAYFVPVEYISTTTPEIQGQVGGYAASVTNQPTITPSFGDPYPAPGTDQPTEIPQVGVPYPAPSALPPTNTPPTEIPYPVPGTESPVGTTQPSNPYSTTITLSPTESDKLPTEMGALTPVVRTELVASDPAEIQLDSGQVQLVEFFAFWCPICKSMAPVVHRLEANYSDRIHFVYLDIDDPMNENFMYALGYKYQPHFFLLDGQGDILNQWLGYVTIDELEIAIINALH